MKTLTITAIAALSLLTAHVPAAAEEPNKPYRPPKDRGMYGSGPGDMRPRAPKVEKESEPVTTALDEQWKWLLGAAVLGLLSYTVWRLWKETNRVTHRKRQPWEIE